MKTIGLLGGMSWQSTELYHRLINREINERLGGLHSAQLALVSVDFHDIEALQRAGDWDGTADILCAKAQQVEKAGADFLLVCTNTMHIVAPQIQAAISIPLLHLADATAEAVKNAGIKRVGLLGTRFTMEEDFYRGRLEAQGLDVMIPSASDRDTIHRVIYDELCQGIVSDDSRTEYLKIVTDLCFGGAEGVIAGCTEIGLLIEQSHVDVPLFDTTVIHAQHAVDKALEG
ncbi:MAG: aspartate/glutamate racemase family protein [Gammaproteobacteria bacterium]